LIQLLRTSKMTGKKYKTFAKTYQSDQGETEDEEVKRNCIMGESGMRDSDFSDSDIEVEDDEPIEIQNEEKETTCGKSRNEPIEELVKFVDVGSQILEPKSVVLCRPKPIVPISVTPAEESEKNDEASSDSNVNGSINNNSAFSPGSKVDNETEPSTHDSGSSRSSSNYSDDNRKPYAESLELGTEMNPTSLDFPFVGEHLSMEVGLSDTAIIQCSEEGCCESLLDGQHLLQERPGGNYALVGASGPSVDNMWLMAMQKQVLSSNALSTLNHETGRSTDLHLPKRMRCSQSLVEDNCAMPEIKLGIEALDQIIQPLPRQYLVREEFPMTSLSSDEEEDKMLSEELQEKIRNDGIGCSCDNSPIPLLTPPQSPRTLNETTDDKTVTTIEWPSNLVMDSAIIKAFANVSPVTTHNNDEKIDPLSIGLSKRSAAPRLRTISVGT